MKSTAKKKNSCVAVTPTKDKNFFTAGDSHIRGNLNLRLDHSCFSRSSRIHISKLLRTCSTNKIVPCGLCWKGKVIWWSKAAIGEDSSSTFWGWTDEKKLTSFSFRQQNNSCGRAKDLVKKNSVKSEPRSTKANHFDAQLHVAIEAASRISGWWDRLGSSVVTRPLH